MRSAASSPWSVPPAGSTVVALAVNVKLRITACAKPVPMPERTALVVWLNGLLALGVPPVAALLSVVSAARLRLPLVIEPAPLSPPVSALSATAALPDPSLTIVCAPTRITSSVMPQSTPAVSVTLKVIVKLPVKFWTVVPAGPGLPPRSADTTAA